MGLVVGPTYYYPQAVKDSEAGEVVSHSVVITILCLMGHCLILEAFLIVFRLQGGGRLQCRNSKLMRSLPLPLQVSLIISFNLMFLCDFESRHVSITAFSAYLAF